MMDRKVLKSSSSPMGFTLIETLIFSAIFTILMAAFISILVTITAIHARQIGVAEVNQQSQFLLQQLRYYVERSSLIEMNPDAPTSTLKLRMAASAEDPTYIYLSSSTIYLKQTEAGSPQPLTSGRVLVSTMTFIKRQNAPSHDSVSISFVIAFNTKNLKQKFSQTLQTAIARVSAATFDSNVIPSSTATYKIGVSANRWNSINDIIYFSGSKMGIGVISPDAKLEVSGGLFASGNITCGGICYANDESALFNLQGYAEKSNPNKNKTYYFGGRFGEVPSETSGKSRIYIPQSGTIKKIYVTFVQSGTGSNETSTIFLRVNDTSNTAISTTVQNNVGVFVASSTNMSVSVTQGDFIEIGWTTPSWEHKPTIVTPEAVVFVE